MPADSTDVRVENHGSIVLFRPLSPAARDWIADHVRADAVWFGGGWRSSRDTHRTSLAV